MKALLLGLMLVPAIAAAAPNTPDAGKMATDDCARARKAGKTCVLDVAAEDVGGSAPTGDGSTVTAIRLEPNASLIRLRRDFIPEILKSAEDL